MENSQTKTNRIKQWFRKEFKLSIYDIAVFGLLLALYFIIETFERYVFPHALKISITYAVFVVFGIILGPIKGSILAFLCDLFTQLIYGIQFYMFAYAIVPVLIAITSWAIFKLKDLKNEKLLWIIGFAIIFVLTIVFIAFLATQQNNIQSGMKRKNPKLISINIVMIVSIISILFIWTIATGSFFVGFFNKNVNKKSSAKTLFVILITVFLIIVLYRWLWGPFAYITFMNRYFVKSNPWSYDEYYFYFMIPIMFKTLIEIPIYTIILFTLKHAIEWMKKHFKNQAKMRRFE
ncbi:ECF transporter S component [[Mycoplasma] gypis]|uniref:ECF transporter S component n=1 Tax=[Mycoplasma] gypis TaxID=92404 RepID=A0ABZ2RNA7_9BACT|nr:ECF transporter S component [[Mycoplasma] gypis]MBN0919341.1 ECF transporter S component [[Mycoplasma] gypis]